MADVETVKTDKAPSGVQAYSEPKEAKAAKAKGRPKTKAYMQNRELSWLSFNERVLDQSIDPNVPLLERMKFIAIWRSNLQEFFMVRVGSLLDLELAKETVYDSKTGMTPAEQLEAVYARVRELTPQVSEDFRTVRHQLEAQGIHQLYPDELSSKQHDQLMQYLKTNVLPLVSPQIVNATHPFPHLENGALYIAVRLDDLPEEQLKGMSKDRRKAYRAKAAEDVVMGIIPMPLNCPRTIELESENGGYSFILLEHALEMVADKIFSMYPVKHANVIQVTRNADLDTYEESDESDEDFRSHMKRILKKRSRLAPVRLESERPLSSVTERFLAKRLGLKRTQIYSVGLPLDMGYAFALPGMVGPNLAEPFVDEPASPQWPAELARGRSIIAQVLQKDVMLSYPYETMDAFVHLLQEAAVDPDVLSIKITLYRLASQSRLAEALITAAENGKEVTALFELRARFDESNNIEWSQRFEQAGCNIIYGFRDFKVHSKICAITRRFENGLQFITQLGTGNYNEKTAKLYTDLSMITADPEIGQDAAMFFRSMQLESATDAYQTLMVAPLMIKQGLCAMIDREIEKAKAGLPAEIMMKTNSVTDREVIEKLAEASRAGVKTTMLVRGISCLIPGIPGQTDNIRVVSVVGRLLEHSRIYVFGVGDDRKVYLSSADLMTRNLDKRVEIAWPVNDAGLRAKVLGYFDTMLSDTAKLRELLPDGSYTELGYFVPKDENGNPTARPFDAQDHLIKEAYVAAENAPRATGPNLVMHGRLSTQIEALAEEAQDDLVYERRPERDVQAIDLEMEAEPARYEGKGSRLGADVAAHAAGEQALNEGEEAQVEAAACESDGCAQDADGRSPAAERADAAKPAHAVEAASGELQAAVVRASALAGESKGAHAKPAGASGLEDAAEPAEAAELAGAADQAEASGPADAGEPVEAAERSNANEPVEASGTSDANKVADADGSADASDSPSAHEPAEAGGPSNERKPAYEGAPSEPGDTKGASETTAQAAAAPVSATAPLSAAASEEARVGGPAVPADGMPAVLTTAPAAAQTDRAASRKEPIGAPADDLPGSHAPGRMIEMPKKKKGFFARLFGR